MTLDLPFGKDCKCCLLTLQDSTGMTTIQSSKDCSIHKGERKIWNRITYKDLRQICEWNIDRSIRLSQLEEQSKDV